MGLAFSNFQTETLMAFLGFEEDEECEREFDLYEDLGGLHIDPSRTHKFHILLQNIFIVHWAMMLLFMPHLIF